MRLALGALAYLCAVVAVIAGAFAGYQAMLPAERTAATASSAPPPPRSEPKRVEPIRPVNDPVQTSTPKYEAADVPLTATAAYNKKKAREQAKEKKEPRERRSAQRRYRSPRLPDEAANAYGSNSYGWGQNNWGQNYAPQQRRSGEWSMY